MSVVVKAVVVRSIISSNCPWKGGRTGRRFAASVVETWIKERLVGLELVGTGRWGGRWTGEGTRREVTKGGKEEDSFVVNGTNYARKMAR